MNQKQNPILRASNTDKDGKPLRLDVGGTRDIANPYAKPKFKLVYDPVNGIQFVSPNTKVRTIQPSDYFD